MDTLTTAQPVRVIALESEPSDLSLVIKLQPAPQKTLVNTPGKSAGDILVKHTANGTELLVSIGPAAKAIPETFRLIGGSITRWLLDHHVVTASISTSELQPYVVNGALSALLEGFFLGGYQFNQHKKVEETPDAITIQLISKSKKDLETSIEHAAKLTSAVNLAREWSHEPANVINPLTLADRAVALAQKYNLKIKVISDQELEAMGAGAIVAVGKGSATPSRLIVVEYPGTNPTAKPVILVGKAITFDTGGYSLKGVDNILNMKYDKSGGIVVLSTLQAAAELKLSNRIIGIVAAAENMIAGHAYRPDDILTTLSGKTVEIISTDAEGRLVLADALTYAQQKYEPRALIDVATLTGGVLVALGRVRAGLLSNNDDLAQRLFDAGQKTHERLWRLPLDEEFNKLIKGDDADIKNSGGREGHCILGGIFLQNFVEETTPWAHLDIAGMADTTKDSPYCPKGGTGFGVRLLINYLENL